MSEELKPCPFCGTSVLPYGQDIRNEQVVEVLKHPSFTGCPLGSLIFSIDAWNTRHDPNPWRYPSRGELPEKDGRYLVTKHTGEVREYDWRNKEFVCEDWGALARIPMKNVRAFMAIPEPAPELEDVK